MKKNLLIISIMLVFTGCAQQSSYFNSTIQNNIKINNLIADDMIDYISSNFNANNTTFNITTTDLNKDFFNYFVNKLRIKGYAITNDNTLQNITFFGYKISKYENNIFVNYNINEQKVNRIYEIIEDGTLVPSGQITNFRK